jgi:rsbT co-antagonist protein RsbR
MSDSSTGFTSTSATAQAAGISSDGLLPQLVQHLRQNRTALREEWARRITEPQLLTAMTPEEVFSEATAVYDNYVEVLETGSVEALQAFTRDISERQRWYCQTLFGQRRLRCVRGGDWRADPG